jgi:hypothetical protein
MTGSAELRRSLAMFACLAGTLILCKLILAPVALDYKTEGQRIVFTWPALAAISAYGFLGVYLSWKAGFPPMWNERMQSGRGPIIAAAHGLVVGLAAVALDSIRPVAEVLGLKSVHIPLPEAIPFYWYGAVVSEIWYHLVPVPLFILVFGGKHHRQKAFWAALIILSAWENRRFVTNPALWNAIECLRNLQTYAANASEIWLFRRYGFLAALLQRLASYSIWHIAWPAIQE